MQYTIFHIINGQFRLAMDTKQLTLYLTLADTLHFGKTGQFLHMSPSAVSRTVQRIEDEVGQKLLLRDSRRVALTDTGIKFQDYARQALEHWQSFNNELIQGATQLHGEVAVYCSVTAVYSVLAEMLGPFRRRYPDIDIILHTGDQADAIDHLLAGAEDIAITARPDHLPATLQFRTLTHSPLLFIYPDTHCSVRSMIRDAVDSSQVPDWSALPFIVSERGQARVQLNQWFSDQGVRARLHAQVSGHEAIVSMVALGFGVAVVPELVLRFSPLKDKVRVLDVQPPLTPFAVGLCARRDQLKNPLVEAFWSFAAIEFDER
jgi:LysR family positive regulator for ilvC